MKIVILAGGTAGHIYPALALADEFKKSNNQVIFFGSKYRMEKDVIPSRNYEFVGLDVIALSGIFNKFIGLYKLIICYFFSRNYLKKNNIELVCGFGNYITVPTLLAAKHLKIKTMIHEQNAYPGKANILLGRYVDLVVGSYESNKDFFLNNCYIYGNPQAKLASKYHYDTNVIESFGLDAKLKTVVIFMGSLGSLSINEFMLKVLNEIKNKEYQVIYVTGKKYIESFTKEFSNTDRIKVVDTINGAKVLASVDLAITRSGATTLAELAALQKPAIVIPSPYVPDNGQYLNAIELEKAKALKVIQEKDLNVTKFIEQIDELLNNEELLKQYRENIKLFSYLDASENIVKKLNMEN